MKKLFLGTIGLTIFAIAVTLTEISCQKSIAQMSNTQIGQHGNLVLYHKTLPYITAKDSLGNVLDTSYWGNEFYLSNIDGSDTKRIPVTLPAGLYAVGTAHLSTDGNTLIFRVTGAPGPGPEINDIYSCSIDGSNLKKIINGPVGLDDVK
jgi:hypothetical protein